MKYSETAKSVFSIYSWIWYMLYFGLTSMFIGFKAVQLVRDEIDDGTLLIFSSIPILRTRMIIEKWLALQFLCLVYSVIILLVPPLISLGMGPKGAALGKVILSKINFMILTSFILQLFLTTIGILISLGLNSKGVIGILFTVGFLTVIGAMIPFIYNSTKFSDKSSAYLMQTTDLTKSPVKFNNSELIKTYHNILDPVGWPAWSYYNNKLQLNINSSLDANTAGSFNVTSLVNNIDTAIQNALTANPGATEINWEQFVAEVKKDSTSYPKLAKLINNNVLEFDGYNPKPFTEMERGNNKVKFSNNTDKGINILGQFYQELASGTPLIVSSAKPSSTKLNLNKIDESKLTSNTSKQIYKIMKTMYDKGVFLPTIIGYDYNSYRSNSYSDLLGPNVITNFIVAGLSNDSHKHFRDFCSIPHTLYIQIDGTYLKMWNEKKTEKKKIKKHSIFSTVHTGFDDEKSTEKRPVIANKLGVIELDNIPEYIKKDGKLTNFVNKLLILITSYYDISDNIEIMVLGDGAPWIKNIAKFIQEYFPKNKVHYTIDKFHLTKRFKDLFPFQHKNKLNKKAYNDAISYFYDGKYEELLNCLESATSFIRETKIKLLKETIRLIKNNEDGVKNQSLSNNIGCHIEGDISHYCKGVLVKKATYHEKTLKNKLNTSMSNFKNKINLFNTNEPLEENRINYSVNNFVNNNLQTNLYVY
ncbi:hypothetical protein TS70_01920 [Spiroplasma sp. hyd1]|nr:hypothetical protein [Spiroplasma sp. hyd1]